MFRNILVPLDGSRLSEASLRAAAVLAEKLGSSVTLLHVIEQDAPTEVHKERHLTRPDEAEAYLTETAQRAFAPSVRVATHVHAAPVADVARSIVQHAAAEFEPDLIVTCTHGRGGVHDLLFGNIAQQIVAHGTTPLLIIKPDSVPLSAVAHFERDTAPLAVRHQGQFPAATLSFNVMPGLALSDAEAAVERAARELRMPEDVRAEFAGNARWLQQSLGTQPLLIAAALISIYIVLGVLYESLLHPLTIISTLPSAGIGALLALLITGNDLSIMGIIGIILLMGIVKKNAIMLVDFALEAERQRGLTPFEAIHEACLERFRPIMMTTMAALLGALPLALAFGTGAELRRPLGISIIGGLIVSQMLTLYTTPVVYLALERLSGRRRPIEMPAPAE